MKNVTLEQLLEAGSHFGHQVTRQNPKARDYIFESRDNIHIIDLAKTKEGLDEAADFVKALASRGGSMIILGAKRQAEPVVREAARLAKESGVNGLYFVSNRWIGGILTNYPEVSKNFKRLKELEKFMDTPSEKARFTKKEVSDMEKKRQKLESFYWGVKDMPKVPDAVFVIDTHMEDLAVKEAISTKVTTVGITDTNADPTIIDFPIPANDDAAGSLTLIVNHIVEAWVEGRKNMKDIAEKEAAVAEKEAKKAEADKEVADKKAVADKKTAEDKAVADKKSAAEKTKKDADKAATKPETKKTPAKKAEKATK